MIPAKAFHSIFVASQSFQLLDYISTRWD